MNEFALVVVHPAACDSGRKENGHDVCADHSQNHRRIHEQHFIPSNHTTPVAVGWFQESVAKAFTVRAARGLLGWTLRDLAKASGIHYNTINSFSGRPETIAAMRKALEKAGVEFTNGKRPGVRMVLAKC